MSLLYLSSRTEFIRAVNLDTGRNILLIGLPDEMVKWLDIGLPKNTPSIPAPAGMEGQTFDIIVWWIEEKGYRREDVDIIRGLLSDDGEFWAIAPREGGLTDDLMSLVVRDVDKGIKPLLITPERDMFPIWVGRGP